MADLSPSRFPFHPTNMSHHKRGRDDDDDCAMQESFPDENQHGGMARWKRFRSTTSNESLCPGADTAGGHMAASFGSRNPEMLIIAKDKEIQGLAIQQSNLVTRNNELQSALSKFNEENKLLKKAVAIQDSRNKEAFQQNEMLRAQNDRLAAENNQRESVLSQAADYVARLESENRMMREYIEALSQGPQQPEDSAGPYNQFPDMPPPDVF